MMIVLNPTYTFTVTIHDRPNLQNNIAGGESGGIPYQPPNAYKFKDDVNGKTGCDEAMKALREALQKAGIDAYVRFIGYSETP